MAAQSGGQYSGDEGNDHLIANAYLSGNKQIELEGGDGDDILELHLKSSTNDFFSAGSLSGGSGSDSFILSDYENDIRVFVDDFEPGIDTLTFNGDKIDASNFDRGLRVEGIKSIFEDADGMTFVSNDTGAGATYYKVADLTLQELGASVGVANPSFGDVNGTPGDDVINLDFVDGEGDRVYNDEIPDLVFAGDGNDKVQVYRGDDTVFGGAGEDSIYGNNGHNELHGGDDNDLVHSGRQTSQLFGDNGEDVLVAQLNKGADHTLTGGEGEDTFQLLGASDAASSQVTITDFSPEGEVLEIDGQIIDFSALPAGYTLSLDENEDVVLTFGDDESVVFLNSEPTDFLIDFLSPGRVDGTDQGDQIDLGFVDAQGDSVTDDDASGDLVEANDGDDEVKLYAGDDTAFGGDGDDSIYGHKGENELHGGNDDDLLHSGRDTSKLFGDNGQDTLLAQLKKGADHELTGGEGRDTFNMLAASDQTTSHITITDFFAGTDMLEIDGAAIDFGDLPDGVTLDEDEDGNAVVSFSDDETVTLTGVTTSSLLLGAPRITLYDGAEIPILPATQSDEPEPTDEEDLLEVI